MTTAVEVVWAPVVAALGSSMLTIFGLLVRDRIAGRAQVKRARLAAYEGLLWRSTGILQLAIALRMTMRFRSGLQEGLDITLGHRRPLDPLDLADRLFRHYDPLFEAQSAVWARGSRESMPVANDLVDKCVDLMGMATERGQAGGRITGYVRGERWTDEQNDAFMAAARALGESRKRLAELLRREGGEGRADLFAR